MGVGRTGQWLAATVKYQLPLGRRDGRPPRHPRDAGPMKYLIWSYDYRHDSGGPKVLHRLCHELNMAGQEAYVSHWTVNPDWETPYAEAPLSGDWTAVYPEIVHGNPWGAPHVVRWVLNTPGLLGGDATYDPSETVVTFSRLFIDEPVLMLPTIELDIYRDEHIERTLPVYYVGKSHK